MLCRARPRELPPRSPTPALRPPCGEPGQGPQGRETGRGGGGRAQPASCYPSWAYTSGPPKGPLTLVSGRGPPTRGVSRTLGEAPQNSTFGAGRLQAPQQPSPSPSWEALLTPRPSLQGEAAVPCPPCPQLPGLARDLAQRRGRERGPRVPFGTPFPLPRWAAQPPRSAAA